MSSLITTLLCTLYCLWSQHLCLTSCVASSTLRLVYCTSCLYIILKWTIDLPVLIVDFILHLAHCPVWGLSRPAQYCTVLSCHISLTRLYTLYTCIYLLHCCASNSFNYSLSSHITLTSPPLYLTLSFLSLSPLQHCVTLPPSSPLGSLSDLVC